MGTQEVELERAAEKSAVNGSDPVCSFISRDKEQYYRPVCVSSCFFSFSVVPNPLQFLLKFFNLLVIMTYIKYNAPSKATTH